MSRLRLSKVKQRYEITPETQKGANNETENHTRIDFVRSSFIYIFNSLTHKSLRTNHVLNAHAHRCRFYRNTADCLVTICGVFIQVSLARASELDQIVVQ